MAVSGLFSLCLEWSFPQATYHLSSSLFLSEKRKVLGVCVYVWGEMNKREVKSEGARGIAVEMAEWVSDKVCPIQVWRWGTIICERDLTAKKGCYPDFRESGFPSVCSSWCSLPFTMLLIPARELGSVLSCLSIRTLIWQQIHSNDHMQTITIIFSVHLSFNKECY